MTTELLETVGIQPAPWVTDDLHGVLHLSRRKKSPNNKIRKKELRYWQEILETRDIRGFPLITCDIRESPVVTDRIGA